MQLASRALIFAAITGSLWCQADAPSSGLGKLKPMVERLREAIDLGDFNRSADALSDLTRAMEALRPPPRSAKERFAELEASIPTDGRLRVAVIRRLAVFAEQAGEFDKARRYAMEAIEFAGKAGSYKVENAFYGNQVLGLLALRENDSHLAAQLLLASLDEGGWIYLGKLGPNMKLSRQLVERGQPDAVVEFVERCKKLWPTGSRRLTDWQAVIRSGGVPDLTYHEALYP